MTIQKVIDWLKKEDMLDLKMFREYDFAKNFKESICPLNYGAICKEFEYDEKLINYLFDETKITDLPHTCVYCINFKSEKSIFVRVCLTHHKLGQYLDLVENVCEED